MRPLVMVSMAGCPYCVELKRRLEHPDTRALMDSRGVELQVIGHRDSQSSTWIEAAEQQHHSVGFPILGYTDSAGRKQTALGLMSMEALHQQIRKV